MSTLTLTPPVQDRVHSEPTLDDLLAGVWEGLSARHAVACPVCAGDMAPVGGAGVGASAIGRCRDCGATLR